MDSYFIVKKKRSNVKGRVSTTETKLGKMGSTWSCSPKMVKELHTTYYDVRPTRIPAYGPSLQHKNLISLTSPLATLDSYKIHPV